MGATSDVRDRPVVHVTVVTNEAFQFLRWMAAHPVATVLWVLVLVPLSVGLYLKGMDLFTLDPFGLPNEVEALWFGINGFLSFFAAAFVLRTLISFKDLWTRQEIWLSRGIFLMVYGGMISYWVRAFTESPGVTIATPYMTLGLLCVLYSTARHPERFIGRFHTHTKGEKDE